MPASLSAKAARRSAPKPIASRKQRKLLIVDDDPSVRRALEVIFREDYRLLLAEDGPTAIALAQKHRIDVALVDIRMAGMSGIEVLERLKYVDPGLEVIMITAHESTETLRQALRLRACDYINKPFDTANLRATVATAMNRRLLASEIHSDAEKLQVLLAELQNQKVEEQIARDRGNIYAQIIHDINTPLTVVSGFLQLMNQRLNHATELTIEDLEFIRERIKTTARHAQSCVELSRRYKSLLRQQPGEIAPVGVNRLLQDVQELLRVHPSAQPHDFEVHLLPGDATVRMNGTEFIQVVLNLVVNAFQCTPHRHQVVLEATLQPRPLDLPRFKDTTQERILNLESFINTPPILGVAVRDNGPGIPPEVLPRIFDPYFSTKDARQGAGLGLNIVQRLIKQAGGAIHVSTRPGEGTTFTIYLPAQAGAPAAPA